MCDGDGVIALGSFGSEDDRVDDRVRMRGSLWDEDGRVTGKGSSGDKDDLVAIRGCSWGEEDGVTTETSFWEVNDRVCIRGSCWGVCSFCCATSLDSAGDSDGSAICFTISVLSALFKFEAEAETTACCGGREHVRTQTSWCCRAVFRFLPNGPSTDERFRLVRSSLKAASSSLSLSFCLSFKQLTTSEVDRLLRGRGFSTRLEFMGGCLRSGVADDFDAPVDAAFSFKGLDSEPPAITAFLHVPLNLPILLCVPFSGVCRTIAKARSFDLGA